MKTGLNGAGRGKGGDNSIIYDKQVTEGFYVIICVDINIDGNRGFRGQKAQNGE